MNLRKRMLQSLALVLVASVTVGAGAASAAKPKPKKPYPTSNKFYMRQEGCGATEEEGRLEPKSGVDGADGCGIIGGLPLDEVFYEIDGPAPTAYRTGKNGMPIILDAKRKVSGQVAVQSWIGDVQGGVGTVEADITLSGITAAGKSMQLGSVSVSAQASPTSGVTKLPYQITLPGGASTTFKTLVLEVATHGLNFNQSAKRFQGDSFVVFPTTTYK